MISIGYDGTVDETPWSKLAPRLGSRYGVVALNDFHVTVKPAADRTVIVAPGTAYGMGIVDTETVNTEVALPLVSSGTQWFLIVLRRNWSGAGGATTVTYVAGGATAAVPSRNVTPGTLDDQPIALVPITAGVQLAGTPIDLRVWNGAGGAFARDPLVMQYVNEIGTQLRIGTDDWTATINGSYVFEWKKKVTIGTRAWSFPRGVNPSSDHDSYSAGSDVGLVGGTIANAPVGWYVITPVLQLACVSGNSPGVIILKANSTVLSCRGDVTTTTRTFSPPFTYYHAGGALTLMAYHHLNVGTGLLANGGSAIVVAFLGGEG